MKKVMVSSLSAFAFCLSSALTVSAAPVIMEATIGPNGSEGGFGYNTVHAATGSCSGGLCKSGARLLDNLGGTLTFTFDDMSGFSMTGVSGLLTGDEGTLEISGGSITDPGDGMGEYASGVLSYELNFTSGSNAGNNYSGNFYFEDQSFSSLGQNGPNNVNDQNFWLWGNNWDVATGGTRDNVLGGLPLGLDIKGGNYNNLGPASVPAPSAMLLMGSGLLGLAAWRMKKSHQA